MTMSIIETKRLLQFQWAKQHAFKPSIRIVSKRTSKQKKDATGQILKDSSVISQRIKYLSWKT